MSTMDGQEGRYDRIAEGYAEWWAPVHRPATLGLLDEVAGDVETGATEVLDVGCGTGALVAATLGRWPRVRVDAVDASEGMLVIARRTLDTVDEDARGRVRFRRADAEALPFDDSTFDLALSAFVLQLVPSRFRALREMRRVLRPGGRLAYVTWLRGGEPFAADGAYHAALLAAGLEPRSEGSDHDDVASPAAAVAQLHRAGLADARARAAVVTHAFTPESFLAFLARFDDEDLFESLEPPARAALEADLLARLRALPSGGLRMTLPIVYASARRR